jgi:D-3-phosphoglycerate dehydrogenase
VLKIAISTTSFAKFDAAPLELCKKIKYRVVINPYMRKVNSQELIRLAKDAVGLIAGTESITNDILLELPKLKVISRCGAGLDNIDLDAAKRLRIKVFNTPDAPTFAVAELTVGLILNLLRKINQADSNIRSSKWEKPMGNLLYGKKVGIIGFGRIGKRVARILSGFGVTIAFYDIKRKLPPNNYQRKGFKDILGWADIITLHLSVLKGQGCIIGKKELGLMKEGAWLINLSRGGVVDEKSLYNTLKCGRLRGAALDVFEKEPYTGCLRELNNVILTPHIGSYAAETRIEMERQAMENLLRGLSAI